MLAIDAAASIRAKMINLAILSVQAHAQLDGVVGQHDISSLAKLFANGLNGLRQ
jgi:hypothetical protein